MDMSMASQSSMTMSIPSTPTAAAAAAASSSSIDSMGGMSMGGMGGDACKISMLWNWYTIDACFLSDTWHIRSAGAFAGACIGVILLVMSLEFLRRAQRELDGYLRRSRENSGATAVYSVSEGSEDQQANKSPAVTATTRWIGRAFGYSGGAAAPLKLWEQAARSFLYMLQFAVAYFVMLLAMYYNGYIIICIFIGAFLGALTFQWDSLNLPDSAEQRDACC